VPMLLASTDEQTDRQTVRRSGNTRIAACYDGHTIVVAPFLQTVVYMNDLSCSR